MYSYVSSRELGINCLERMRLPSPILTFKSWLGFLAFDECPKHLNHKVPLRYKCYSTSARHSRDAIGGKRKFLDEGAAIVFCGQLYVYAFLRAYEQACKRMSCVSNYVRG